MSTTTHAKNLCTSVTRDRRPCDALRLGWSRFCWYHQPWPEIGLSTVIALFVVLNVMWFIALRGGQITRELVDRLSAATARENSFGAQHFALPALRADERVTIGSVAYGSTPHEIVRLGDSEYVIDRLPDGAFSLSTEIRDRSGQNVVARLEGSRLFVSPGAGYDVNSDANAIEVVDAESRPVLQFTQGKGGLVGWIRAYQKSGEVLLCGIPCSTVSEKEALPALAQQHRIFRYPGYLYSGTRER